MAAPTDDSIIALEPAPDTDGAWRVKRYASPSEEEPRTCARPGRTIRDGKAKVLLRDGVIWANVHFEDGDGEPRAHIHDGDLSTALAARGDTVFQLGPVPGLAGVWEVHDSIYSAHSSGCTYESELGAVRTVPARLREGNTVLDVVALFPEGDESDTGYIRSKELSRACEQARILEAREQAKNDPPGRAADGSLTDFGRQLLHDYALYYGMYGSKNGRTKYGHPELSDLVRDIERDPEIARRYAEAVEPDGKR